MWQHRVLRFKRRQISPGGHDPPAADAPPRYSRTQSRCRGYCFRDAWRASNSRFGDRHLSATGIDDARGGHTALLLSTGKVLIVGGYGTNTYPNIAPAELYDPASGTFASAGPYVGRGGCDFCAPSILLFDGTVLFPGQYPAQLYDPARDAFSPIGMMIRDPSTAAPLRNGQVLFAGGENWGRSADAELYNPATRTFVSTGSMASRRVWHTLSLLPTDGPAAGGETDSCRDPVAGLRGLATAELSTVRRVFFPDRQHGCSARNPHATVLKTAGVGCRGVTYGGIGIFGGISERELYSPDVLVRGLHLFRVRRRRDKALSFTRHTPWPRPMIQLRSARP